MASIQLEALTGKVVSIDPAAGTLVVDKTTRASGERVLLNVARNAKIERGTTLQPLRELKAGESVAVQYVHRKGQLIAERVEVLTSVPAHFTGHTVAHR